jgi:uncharacterized membrane protein YcaP (DUF421 family)
MADITIFDPIPWKTMGTTALQTAIIYSVIIVGLKLVGRRVFAELGPQDLVVLLLVAEATDIGLTPTEGGFWASIASVGTILAVGGLIERIPPLKKWVEDSAVVLLDRGKILRERLRRNLVNEDDLQATARKYGLPNTDAFETMTLESDGSISGVLKPEYRSSGKNL